MDALKVISINTVRNDVKIKTLGYSSSFSQLPPSSGVLGRDIKCLPMSQGGGPTHTVTGKILLAAVMVMQVLNTTCSQCPCSTQSSEFQDTGRVKVMFISSWASRPKHKNVTLQREHNRLV